MKVTKDTVTISEIQLWIYPCSQGQTVQLKDTDPNELQRFIEKLPSSIKGKTKSMNVISNAFFVILVLEQRGTWLNLQL